ncbi:ATP synthase epsilon chain, sodium ion specific [Novipirellula aureliae]|uniref:ATP synthase epsilon chain n=1 Tax=Novipirellula aureliae TaxID=2527966 RepID=A0A5C6DNE8_9BACT|nr:ATP synthase F1 subunit epsilon [Novipirellula aureliae]TWU37714.1 ATP synthase epsilon chain, sodium ion specific [Novipirellula aureliae]
MSIRCVVVTPEKTEFDREADSVVLPMFDGELGVMKGHSPFIGRLGYGTLKLETAAGQQRYFIDGGFAQVEDNTVNVLTSRAIPVDLLSSEEAQSSLDEAFELPSATPEQVDLKENAVRRARGKLRASR